MARKKILIEIEEKFKYLKENHIGVYVQYRNGGAVGYRPDVVFLHEDHTNEEVLKKLNDYISKLNTMEWLSIYRKLF